jgi:hypothetical protein
MKTNDLLLYHGTDALMEGNIGVRSNTGVGSNDLTLGNGFYTSTSKEVALFYSHIMMRERLFDLGLDPDHAHTGEVHQIVLSDNFKLLKESDKLDVGASITVLKQAGISMTDISMLSPSELASFPAVLDLIDKGGFQQNNSKEFLARQMGYDGLLMVQKPYLPWHYEPRDIGVNWDRCWASWKNSPPATLVIYNTEKIVSSSLIHSGLQSMVAIHAPNGHDVSARF